MTTIAISTEAQFGGLPSDAVTQPAPKSLDDKLSCSRYEGSTGYCLNDWQKRDKRCTHSFCLRKKGLCTITSLKKMLLLQVLTSLVNKYINNILHAGSIVLAINKMYIILPSRFLAKYSQLTLCQIR